MTKIKNEGQYGEAVETLEILKEMEKTFWEEDQLVLSMFELTLRPFQVELDNLIKGYEKRTASAEVKRVRTLATTQED